MKPKGNFIKDFFGFSQREMNGFVVMLGITILAVLATVVYDRLSVKPTFVDPIESKVLDSLVSILNENQADIPKAQNYKPRESKVPVFRKFDPNLASKEDFVELGLKPYLAERIEKYRSKGGKFKIKTDLKKIYGFPESLYLQLEEYVDLPENFAVGKKSPLEKQWKKNTEIQKLKVEFTKQDLNKADSIALEKVYGVGLKLASRIIKYREKLGGFVNVTQLKEVWGLDSTTIQEIDRKFSIDDGFQPKKINANTDDFQLLRSHPYVGYQKAKLITSYRKQHGMFHSIEQMRQIQTMSAEDIEKMKSYLVF